MTLSGRGDINTLPSDALGEAGCVKFFQDKISSRKADRPGLAAALEYLRRGDTLVVWKLDRLGRSVKDVLTIADELHEHRIGLRILTGTLAFALVGPSAPRCRDDHRGGPTSPQCSSATMPPSTTVWPDGEEGGAARRDNLTWEDRRFLAAVAVRLLTRPARSPCKRGRSRAGR